MKDEGYVLYYSQRLISFLIQKLTNFTTEADRVAYMDKLMSSNHIGLRITRDEPVLQACYDDW